MYLYLSLLLCIFSILDVYTKYINKYHKLYTYLFFTLWIFFMVAFRDCGFDYDNYKHYFNYITNSVYWESNASDFGVETGYALLNYYCTSFRQLLIIMATLTVGIYFIYIYKKSNYPFISIFLLLGSYVYPMMMGQYRQALAIGICLIAVEFRKHKALSIFIILIASLFHVSAFLGLLFLIIPEKEYNWRVYVLLLLFALISNLLLGNIFKDFISSMPTFVEDKLDYYTVVEKETKYGLNLAMLLKIFIFCILWWRKEYLFKDKENIYFLNIYFMSLLIYLGLGFLPQLSGRGSIYFYFFEVIIASRLLYSEKDKILKLSFLVFFIMLGFYRQVSFFSEWSKDFIPYKYNLFSDSNIHSTH
ncbi:MAG: EpsG family protein [Phocaeicola sp.]|nr:EpsG family protein [Phocaeicola sp.]